MAAMNMAAMQLTTSERAKCLQMTASNLAGMLERFRSLIDSADVHVHTHRRLTQEGKVQSRLALAELEVALARVEQQQAQVDRAIDDFTVMWQELRAELDLAHVLAVTPE